MRYYIGPRADEASVLNLVALPAHENTSAILFSASIYRLHITLKLPMIARDIIMFIMMLKAQKYDHVVLFLSLH